MFSKLVFDLDGIQVDVHLHEVVALLQQIVGSSIQNSSSNLQVPNYTCKSKAQVSPFWQSLMSPFFS